MEYLPELLTVAGIHLLGVASPGPDFAMIARSSLVYSRTSGLYSAVGLGLGVGVHTLYCLLGIGLIISQSILLFTTIKYIGAAYLIIIGIRSLRAQKGTSAQACSHATRSDITRLQALRLGFLTNTLNPKATLFFLAMFTQVIHPQTPLAVQGLYAFEMIIMTMVWFACVAFVLSSKKVRGVFSTFQHHVERVFGALLIALGVKVAFSSQK